MDLPSSIASFAVLANVAAMGISFTFQLLPDFVVPLVSMVSPKGAAGCGPKAKSKAESVCRKPKGIFH